MGSSASASTNLPRPPPPELVIRVQPFLSPFANLTSSFPTLFIAVLLLLATTTTTTTAVEAFQVSMTIASTTRKNTMAHTTTSKLYGKSVAILGSGIAGSTAARALADYGLNVTVFEAGRGIGGRTSTRVTTNNNRNNDNKSYQFDHGAQYIGRPKTDTFRTTLNEWISKGWVQPWHGRFATEIIQKDSDTTVSNNPHQTKIVIEEEEKDPSSMTTTKTERYVGSPKMNSICHGLLDHENIRVVLQTRVDATFDDQQKQWELQSGSKPHSGSLSSTLGIFDWLVASDRLSIGSHRTDLPKSRLGSFQKATQSVKNIKCLCAMVVFDSPLDFLPVDGVRFLGGDANNRNDFGSLGWIARDSSKPGRQRSDGRECWVLQSHPGAAEQILKSMPAKSKIQDIRDRARDELVSDFLHAIPKLATQLDGTTSVDRPDIPSIIESIGHRWGAAFPNIGAGSELSTKQSSIDTTHRFLSCGDYYGTLTGRIEGAYLSGASASSQLIQYLDEERKATHATEAMTATTGTAESKNM